MLRVFSDWRDVHTTSPNSTSHVVSATTDSEQNFDRRKPPMWWVKFNNRVMGGGVL